MNRRKLRKVALKSLQAEGFTRPAEISIVLTSDEHIRELNRTYRGLDRPTDVLAFSQLEGEVAPPENGNIVLGDVIISVDTAKRQAAEHGQSLEDELALLVAHGVLHLLGRDDTTEAGAAQMRRIQDEILEQVT